MNPAATAPNTGRHEWERRANERTGAGAVMDPYPRLAELRAKGGLQEGSLFDLFGVDDPMRSVWPDTPRFTSLSFEVTQQVLRDGAAFTQEGIRKLTEKQFGAVSLMGTDDPEHRRYRIVTQPAFGHKALDMWRRWLSPRLDELIDGFVQDRRVDLYPEYCARFPVYVIAMALGVAVEDLGEFHEWAGKLQIAAAPLDETLAARAKVVEYLKPIIASRREQPKDDLIGILVQTEVEEYGEKLRISDEQIIGLVCNLLPAGSGTTYRSLGIALVTLLERPEIFAKLVADRTLGRRMLEEVLRWNGPVMTAPPRYVTKDVVLDGVAVPKGALIEPCIGAANRDPAQFERAEEFDPFRPNRPNLGFSAGSHFCLGAQVARLELEGALDRLVERLPGLRLDPEAPPPEITGLWYRMPTGVPAIWE